MKKLYAAVIIAFLFFIIKLPYIVEAMDSRLAESMQNTLMPVLTYYDSIENRRIKSGVESIRDMLLPASGYAADKLEAVVLTDNKTIMVGAQTSVNSQSNIQANAQTVTPPDTPGKTVYFKAKDNEKTEAQKVATVSTPKVMTGNLYSKAQLNYSFLMSNFYTVTSITELNSNMLRPADFLSKDLSMEKKEGTPQILIFHTHSQEDFADSKPGDNSTTIIGVGDYLATLLHDRYGYEVYHDTTVYDFVDGKLDRNAAYTYAQENVEKILEKYPSIEVVIDLHRDGVDENTRLVTQVNGKPTAKIMFFNGLSYSKLNGDIDYLPNPNRDDNLAMSLQMQLLGNAYYPGFLRRIYINSYRYVLHLRGKSTLIEAGAQNNTVAEVKNAMEPLADILDRLLKGEKGYTN